MKDTTVVISILLAALAVLLAAGCNNSNDMMTNSNPSTQPAIVRVAPANSAVGVPVSSSVGIKFNTPMDTLSVMAGFHFSGGSSMQMWMDSVNHMGGMAHMGTAQKSHMMQVMHSLELHGHFQWNAGFDSCLFTPDSTMMFNTSYMTFMYGQIKSTGGMMMNMGGSGMMSSDTGFMYHFMTAP